MIRAVAYVVQMFVLTFLFAFLASASIITYAITGVILSSQKLFKLGVKKATEAEGVLA